MKLITMVKKQSEMSRCFFDFSALLNQVFMYQRLMLAKFVEPKYQAGNGLWCFSALRFSNAVVFPVGRKGKYGEKD